MYVPLSSISDYLQVAVISMEDRRFYQHQGVDWRGTVRALLRNAQSDQRSAQGGSTLTQQYVKNYLYLVEAKTEAEKADAIATTPIRKLREAKMALSLEQNLSKAEILERYLNLVAFGPSQYGAEAASQWFFGTSADQLTLAQAALLAGMVNNPPKYNPLDENHVQDARDRRDLVLDVMVAAGRLSKATAEETKKQDLGLNPNRTRNGCIPADNSETNGFFCQYALDYLSAAGFDAKTVARSGWTIKTTLDPAVMAVGEGRRHVERGPDRARRRADRQRRRGGRQGRAAQGARAGREPTLRAGRRQGPDRAAAAHHLRAARRRVDVQDLHRGRGDGDGAGHQRRRSTCPPSTPARWSRPNAFKQRRQLSGQDDPRAGAGDLTEHRVRRAGGPGRPAEGRRDGGPARAARLLAGRRRRSTPPSPAPAPTTPRRSSRRRWPRSPSACPRSARWSWPTSAPPSNSDGKWCPPTPIDTITDRNGKFVTWDKTPCEQAVPAELARTLAVAMEGDLAGDGTAAASASAAGWTWTAAGKTGTTQEYKSSAFLGFTPEMSASVIVWDSEPRPQSICSDPIRTCSTDEAMAGNGMSGGSVPAPAWFAAMKPLKEGQPDTFFRPASPAYLQGVVQHPGADGGRQERRRGQGAADRRRLHRHRVAAAEHRDRREHRRRPEPEVDGAARSERSRCSSPAGG